MNYSAIDHFISSPELLSPQQFVHVLDDGDNLSDHLAIHCWFQSSYNTASSEKYNPTKLLWDRPKADIGYYQSVLGLNLSTIALPVDALLCTSVDSQVHRDTIESCIAVILLFYRHYLVAFIRLLLLLAVCVMCYRRNCQTTQSEN